MLLAAAVANWHNIGKMNENASGDDFMLYVFPVMLMKPSKFAGRYTLEFKDVCFPWKRKYWIMMYLLSFFTSDVGVRRDGWFPVRIIETFSSVKS